MIFCTSRENPLCVWIKCLNPNIICMMYIIRKVGVGVVGGGRLSSGMSVQRCLISVFENKVAFISLSTGKYKSSKTDGRAVESLVQESFQGQFPPLVFFFTSSS